MKITIRDIEAAKGVSPMDAVYYLRAKGWEQRSAVHGLSSTWELTADGEVFEVLLPMTLELDDYALRIGEMLSVLSAVEKRSQGQVYNDLQTVASDIVRIRFIDPELKDGTLPIEEYARIAQKTRDLMLASACAATEPRAFWPQRRPAIATEHVRRIRIGQSERGSYIVTVISRIAPQLCPGEQCSLLPDEPPFERWVTETLARSLNALNCATERALLTQKMEPFYQAIDEGVSANLCDAVSGLAGEDEPRRDLEFSFAWSPVRPMFDEPARKVTFSSDRIPFVREAGRQLRDREPLQGFDLSGPVVKLERPETAETGRVTVIGFVEERQTRVLLELKDAQYHVAVRAHDGGLTIRTTGTLVREGRSYVLKNPADLIIERE